MQPATKQSVCFLRSGTIRLTTSDFASVSLQQRPGSRLVAKFMPPTHHVRFLPNLQTLPICLNSGGPPQDAKPHRGEASGVGYSVLCSLSRFTVPSADLQNPPDLPEPGWPVPGCEASTRRSIWDGIFCSLLLVQVHGPVRCPPESSRSAGTWVARPRNRSRETAKVLGWDVLKLSSCPQIPNGFVPPLLWFAA